MSHKRTIAIIPARGGSNRIAKKNIKEFNGSPLIKYSIEAAINSNIFDRIIVSTDDNDIAEISLNYGAEVPFFRSKETSDEFILDSISFTDFSSTPNSEEIIFTSSEESQFNSFLLLLRLKKSFL